MSTKAQVKTQAKTPAAPVAAHILQPPVAEPEHVAERPDIAAQLEGAARLGHSLGDVNVDSPGPPIIQRQGIPEEEEEELQLKREAAAVQRLEQPQEEEDLMLKRDDQRVGPQGGQVPPDVEAAIRRARGGGQPLAGALREQMSASLGHDFSGVRVHTDLEADDLNHQLQAKAFTTGLDIFFKRGTYDPASRGSRELIAHELSHVVQQSSGRASGDGSGIIVRPAGDAFEQEADRGAEAATRSTFNSVQEQTILAQYEERGLLALQRAVARPDLASPAQILALQRMVGNRAGQGPLTIAKSGHEKGVHERLDERRTGDGDLPAVGIIQRMPLNAAKARVDAYPGLLCYVYCAAVLFATRRPWAPWNNVAPDIARARIRGFPRNALHNAFATVGQPVQNPVADLQGAVNGSILGIRRNILQTWSDHVMIKVNGLWHGTNNPEGVMSGSPVPVQYPLPPSIIDMRIIGWPGSREVMEGLIPVVGPILV